MAVQADPTLTAPLRMESDGTARVGSTRVTLDVLLGAYNLRKSPKAIVEAYPTLDIADVYAVIAYYLQNKAEVDEYLRVRAEEAGDVRSQIEALPGNKAFRDLIRARGKERTKA